MDSVWCFQCGAEYVAEVTECLECGIPTEPDPPIPPEYVGTPDEDQLAYELHEWSVRGRTTLHRRLVEAGIVHGWQGATMFVREADEDAVDGIVAEVGKETLPTLDPEDDVTTYEVDDLDSDQMARLLRLLDRDGIPHELDEDGALVVSAASEEMVDEIFAELAEPEEDPARLRFGTGVDGVDPSDVVSELFLIADRLRRDPRDHRGVLDLLEYEELARGVPLPYGFEPRFWRSVLDETAGVRAMLESDEADDEAIRRAAGQLNERLRAVI